MPNLNRTMNNAENHPRLNLRMKFEMTVRTIIHIFKKRIFPESHKAFLTSWTNIKQPIPKNDQGKAGSPDQIPEGPMHRSSVIKITAYNRKRHDPTYPLEDFLFRYHRFPLRGCFARFTWRPLWFKRWPGRTACA